VRRGEGGRRGRREQKGTKAYEDEGGEEERGWKARRWGRRRDGRGGGKGREGVGTTRQERQGSERKSGGEGRGATERWGSRK
jgi:hypothetical protein